MEENPQERIREMRDRRNQHMKEAAFKMIERGGNLPPTLLEQLATFRDEELYQKLVKANSEGKLAELVESEPKLQETKKQLDQSPKE